MTHTPTHTARAARTSDQPRTAEEAACCCDADEPCCDRHQCCQDEHQCRCDQHTCPVEPADGGVKTRFEFDFRLGFDSYSQLVAMVKEATCPVCENEIALSEAAAIVLTDGGGKAHVEHAGCWN